jgi:transposase
VSNILKVNLQEAIRSLRERGWSERRIAKELRVNRRTVRRYGAVCAEAKCTISIPGSEDGAESKCTTDSINSIPGSDGADTAAVEVPPSGSGRRSDCAPWAAVIEAKLELGLTAKRIHQDLVAEHGFTGSYQSVKRYAQHLKAARPERVWRLECRPGEEMQVDFGLGAPIDDGKGGTRRTWVFRVVLSYSRKGYSEVVLRQDTETFLRCLENSVRSFGGAPLLLNLDNLKAAVLRADWFDPEINPKLAEFCRHYGMSVMPCRPYTPQHKGKVERGIAYVRGNALKGRRFASLSAQNLHLAEWEKHVADTRIHGTTRQQVAACFAEEAAHLQPLPTMVFPCYHEARRTVHRDGYVEVDRAYYEAPTEYLGRTVWVRWDSRCVRIFNDRLEQVQIHQRVEPGKFSRSLGAVGWSAPVHASCRYWIDRAAVLGEACGAWAQELFDRRGAEAMRTIIAVCGLTRRHSGTALNRVCTHATAKGLWRYKDLQRLLERPAPAEQEELRFAESHPLIRDLQNYADFIEDQAALFEPHL